MNITAETDTFDRAADESRRQVAEQLEIPAVAELLEICRAFFADTSRSAVWHELDHTLLARDITGGPGWLIDMLGLHAQHLRASTNPEGAPR